MKHYFTYTLFILCFVRCAQITPLTGGKKDTEAPKLIKANPANATLNFSSKKIELQFDEFISLKDVANQFIITPQTKELPEIDANGKTVTVKFKEALMPNTTYKLSFGNSIIDLRESNNLPNFEYVFSTGSVIDSQTVKGQIINALDKKPAARVTVGLYLDTAADSVIYKEKPLYLIKTSDDGKFILTHLPDKKFKIIAIKDLNKNLTYDGPDEEIAYTQKTIDTKDSIEINLLLFKEVPFKNFIKKPIFVEFGKVFIIYNKPQYSIKNVKANGLILYTTNKLKDTLTLYYNNKFDTLETYISYEDRKTDTVYVKIPSVNYRIERQTAINTYHYTFITNIISPMPFFIAPSFKLNYPVLKNIIDQTKITLWEQHDTTKTTLKNFKLNLGDDPVTEFIIETNLFPETNYTLTLADSALIGNPLRYNDSTTFKFTTSGSDDYAQLNLKLLFPKKENYIVRLLNSADILIEERIIEVSLTSTAEKILEYKNLVPGNYFLQVVEDANKNRRYDVGNYFNHTQPEIIFINNTPIKLLAGWEIENEWIIKQ